MSDLVLLSRAQMRRIEPFFPRSRGLPRVDDRRVVSGIIYVIRHGLQWKDAPPAYGPPKTLYNRFIRWSRLGVFARIFAALAAEGDTPARLMIDDIRATARSRGGTFRCSPGPPRPRTGSEASTFRPVAQRHRMLNRI